LKSIKNSIFNHGVLKFNQPYVWHQLEQFLGSVLMGRVRGQILVQLGQVSLLTQPTPEGHAFPHIKARPGRNHQTNLVRFSLQHSTVGQIEINLQKLISRNLA